MQDRIFDISFFLLPLLFILLTSFFLPSFQPPQTSQSYQPLLPSLTPESSPMPEPSPTPESYQPPMPSLSPEPSPTPESYQPPMPSLTPESSPTPEPYRPQEPSLTPESYQPPEPSPTPTPYQPTLPSLTPEPNQPPESSPAPEMYQPPLPSLTPESSPIPEPHQPQEPSLAPETSPTPTPDQPPESYQPPLPSLTPESPPIQEPSLTPESYQPPMPSLTPEPSLSPESYQPPESSPKSSPTPELYQPPLPSLTPESSPIPEPSLNPTSSPIPEPNHPPSPPPPPPREPMKTLFLTPPLPIADLPLPSAQCTFSLLSYSFTDIKGKQPISVLYSPPSECRPPWSAAIIQLSGTVYGDQYDHIAAVWLAGAEILRTSTPEPSENGTSWNVRKDVTRYTSLLQQSNVSLTMMLENVASGVFTGAIDVNLTFMLYEHDQVVRDSNFNSKFGGLGSGSKGIGKVVGDYEEPADMVIPVGDEANQGSWFHIEDNSQVGSKNVVIPMNARRIVLELYVSSHGDDEFWYSNPPNKYIKSNNLPTNRGNGAFREVFARIDGNVVASEVPFPIFFTGGINPFFWKHVVAIGTFDLPSYEFDLTPFLGSLLDGKRHSFELGVTNAIRFWLVDANLHIWLDKRSSKVKAQMGVDKPPKVKKTFKSKFKKLDGEFKVEVERKSQLSGWVATSSGKFTTSIEKKMKFKNSIKYERGGTYKTVEQKVEVKTQVKVISAMGSEVYKRSSEREYPLKLITSTVRGLETNTDLITTKLTHSLEDKSSYGKHSSSVHNTQESGGWILVKGHSVLNGSAETQQSLSYKSDSGCYYRSVKATNERLVTDHITTVCLGLFHKVLNVLLSVW